MVNAFLEKSPGGPSDAVRTSRPGLRQLFTVGAGPILRTFEDPGVFGGDPFNVSGSQLYRMSTLLGSVAYSAAPRFAAAAQASLPLNSGTAALALVVGGALYIYDGSTLKTQTTFDDGYSLLPPFSSVAILYNIFIYTVQGTNLFFFSRPGNPAIINAANFSAAQTTPTPILEVGILGEEIYFFKPDAVEIWDFTGNLTAPFAESPGRTYARGCTAQSSVVRQDNSLFWVGDDYTVYRTGTVPQRISTSMIEDRLRAVSQSPQPHLFTALGFSYEGHVYYVLLLPSINESYCYDCQTQQWFFWGTQQPDFPEPGLWLASTAAGQGNQIYLGSATDGRVFTPDAFSYKDDTTPMRVVVSGAIWIPEGVLRLGNLTLHMVRGVATASVPNPLVEMRYSDDGGRTWTPWQVGQIGGIGGYKFKASWHSLGYVRQPGREFEFAITDAVNVTLEGAAFNTARR